ncbi:translesion DNA synthesis-associated protein ImuA [Eleftheria terrae]|uniref:translesion DNA synthesis-associated protein ImuA n=1 Tax=Eleftheria terrae TaxID=1597781 RepID=UPI00263B6C5D|nr:translesion DNA synthesis-associated protein ImuA [Eleftheria terrae]WKB52078.1 translesion DNA synthesis-associated protein ImuA [Eleftheria terrae]
MHAPGTRQDLPPSSPARPVSPPDMAAPGGRLSVDELQGRLGAAMWRADQLANSSEPVLPSGHAALDAELPGGGWPCRSLIDILQPAGAACEWRLLGPCLPRLCDGGRSLVLVGAPALAPGAPALQPQLPGLLSSGLELRQLLWLPRLAGAQALWAIEQALHCRDSGAVLGWLPQARPEALRRLHAHAQAAGVPLFMFRPEAARHAASAAPLRLLLAPAELGGLQVTLLKRRGPPRQQPLALTAQPPGVAPLVAVKWRAVMLARQAPAAVPDLAELPGSQEPADAVLAGTGLPRVAVPA